MLKDFGQIEMELSPYQGLYDAIIPKDHILRRLKENIDMGQRLGKYIGRYREAYFVPDRWGNGQVFSWKLRPGAEDAIYRKIRDITVSMKSVDHLKMPECVMNRITVRMDERERAQYETLKRKRN